MQFSWSRRAFGRFLGQASSFLPLLLASAARGEERTGGIPGSPRTTRSRLLDTGADALQGKPPVDAMSLYLDGFHFYADDMGRQVEAHHYCTHLNEDFHQCVIFDRNDRGARLIGVEYIVSERLFRRLPDDEKRLWHSHHYEVKSGELLAPGIPERAEHAAMADVVTTYGKTWHTWQYDRDELPLGLPRLMMGFTADGQVNPDMLHARDQRLGILTEERRRDRADIPMPVVLPGANAWEKAGRTVQLTTEEVPVRNRRG